MKAEYADILKRASQSIEAAELLRTQALYGFAVSRAYYAMFYLAEALRLSKGLAFSKHSAVIAAFGEHFAKPKVLNPIFHQHLIEAVEKRQLGDDAFQAEIEPADAKGQIERARAFLQAAQAWLEQQPSPS